MIAKRRIILIKAILKISMFKTLILQSSLIFFSPVFLDAANVGTQIIILMYNFRGSVTETT